MKYKKIYHKICVICNRPFDCGRVNQNCCSPECTYQKKLQNYREYNAKLKKMADEAIAEIPARNNDIESLAEVNAKARALGMSYGQYDLARRMGRVANG